MCIILEGSILITLERYFLIFYMLKKIIRDDTLSEVNQTGNYFIWVPSWIKVIRNRCKVQTVNLPTLLRFIHCYVSHL